MRVTKDTHPHLHEALDNISHDGGGRCNAWYEIPEDLTPILATVDKTLATLNEADLQTFCIGEETEMQVVADRSAELQFANQFLNTFFDSGWNRGRD